MKTAGIASVAVNFKAVIVIEVAQPCLLSVKLVGIVDENGRYYRRLDLGTPSRIEHLSKRSVEPAARSC